MLNHDYNDISVPLTARLPVWPGNAPFLAERIEEIGCCGGANVSRLALGTHTGTHLDAPFHFLPDGATIDTMPLTVTLGRARVIEVPTSMDRVTPGVLGVDTLKRGERILLKTRNSAQDWPNRPFDERFVALTLAAAEALAGAGVMLIGVDYLSVGPFSDAEENAAIHRCLLSAGVWILEGLDLGRIEGGLYDLVCLPLKLHGLDGAPCRALLRPLPAS